MAGPTRTRRSTLPPLGALRRAAGLLALTVAAVAVAIGVVVFDPLDRLSSTDQVAASVPRDEAEITVTGLSRTVETEGELVPAWQRAVGPVGPGTVTDLRPEGAAVDAGTVVVALDDEPTSVLVGDVPAWRSMSIDDVGPDVAQLEANLVALGYDPDGSMTVDDTYTDVTAAVVERWQTDLGVDATGAVPFGSVAFAPAPATITSITGSVGQTVAAGSPTALPTPLLTLSAIERELVFAVATADIDTIEIGGEVSARLPDRSTITARVVDLVAVGDGLWSAGAVPVPSAETTDEPLPDGESVPLTVSWTATVAEPTTTVPARALTRLDTGAYVVEVVEGTGTRFVEVELGASSGSTVEIITDLAPGTVVIAP